MTDAAWALAGVIVGSLGTGLFNLLLQRKQFTQNKEMFLLQNKGTEIIKNFLTEMLSHSSYTDRSFAALKAPSGGISCLAKKNAMRKGGRKMHNPALNRTCAKSRAGRLAPRYRAHRTHLFTAEARNSA